MAVATMLADAGRRSEDGRWQRGAVPEQTGNRQLSVTQWEQAMRRAGHIIDHAPADGP